MPNLRERVSVKCTDTGTNYQITLGDALPGYRTFSSAFPSDYVNVSYVIVDGVNWETGIGTYMNSTNQLYRYANIASTSGFGQQINLSGNAVVSVTFTSDDSVADWPILQVRTSAPVALTGGGWRTLQFDTVLRDTTSGWTTPLYTTSTVGGFRYELQLIVPNSPPAGSKVGLIVDTNSGISPASQTWFPTLTGRDTNVMYTRTQFSVAQAAQVRAYAYLDGFDASVTGTLTVMRVR